MIPDRHTHSSQALNRQSASDLRCFLSFIHNHKFEQNIGKLDQLYAARFPDRLHLVPFYEGSLPHVCPVYETSFCFQGFLAQAAHRFNDTRFSHYVFAGDDLLLHPSLNADNLVGELQLDADTGFIDQPYPMREFTFRWKHLASTFLALEGCSGANWHKEMPSFEEAGAILERKGFPVCQLGWRHFARGVKLSKLGPLAGFLLARLRRMLSDRKASVGLRDFPYPMVVGYSDFIVVPRSVLPRFCHLCGVFAAAGVFAEIATPTALLLSCNKVRFDRDNPWSGREIWDADESKALEKEHGLDVAALLRAFPRGQLYVHPIKLSRWRVSS